MRSDTGWSKPLDTRKFHYFIDGRSLCNQWLRRSFVPVVPALADRCKRCERKRQSEGREKADSFIPCESLLLLAEKDISDLHTQVEQLRTVGLHWRNALRDILCITKENYHTGCTCLSCTAYEIARKALEGK